MRQRPEFNKEVAACELVVQRGFGGCHGGFNAIVGDVHYRLYHQLVIPVRKGIQLESGIPRNAFHHLLVRELATYLLNIRRNRAAIAYYCRERLRGLFVNITCRAYL